MPLTKIQSLGITDGTIVNADINASAAIAGTKISNLNDAKAWINFNGTGTPAIRASFNVSSITDNGTGDYTINFTNALTDANFSSSLTCSGDGGGELRCPTGLQALYSTTACRFQTTSANGTLVDVNGVYASIFR
jgi:hypothetical protein